MIYKLIGNQTKSINIIQAIHFLANTIKGNIEVRISSHFPNSVTND